MPRRNLKQLEQAVESARSNRARAVALYRLAVFHDNNGGEVVAIPLYRRAISLGLDRKIEVFAIAWLASSLFKTGRSTAAMRCVRRAMGMSPPRGLRVFLTGLQRRIKHGKKRK
jgi:hypothetical protein